MTARLHQPEVEDLDLVAEVNEPCRTDERRSNGDGEIVFKHACKLGCEGTVSKRLGSLYRSGRPPHWVKVKNPNARASM